MPLTFHLTDAVMNKKRPLLSLTVRQTKVWYDTIILSLLEILISKMNTHVLKRKISINEKGIISLQGDPIPISDELIILDRDRGICNSTAKKNQKQPRSISLENRSHSSRRLFYAQTRKIDHSAAFLRQVPKQDFQCPSTNDFFWMGCQNVVRQVGR